MTIRRLIFALSGFAAMCMPAFSQNYTSTYTNFNFDRDCSIYEEYELGVSAKCKGYLDFPVYFSEGDLRVMVRFGHTSPKTERWETFVNFNNIGTTIEWRLRGGVPVATILRWYIQSDDTQTGTPEEGQVLVVSTVAGFHDTNNACIAGYVDARANSNANVLARRVADTVAVYFKCGVDRPKYYGARGPQGSLPTNYSE